MSVAACASFLSDFTVGEGAEGGTAKGVAAESGASHDGTSDDAESTNDGGGADGGTDADTGARDGTGAVPADAATDAAEEPTPVCCVGTMGNVDNVHCGVGASAPCGNAGSNVTTYNSAECDSPVIGASCVSWPQSSGSPSACLTSEPCCAGTVQACP